MKVPLIRKTAKSWCGHSSTSLSLLFLFAGCVALLYHIKQFKSTSQEEIKVGGRSDAECKELFDDFWDYPNSALLECGVPEFIMDGLNSKHGERKPGYTSMYELGTVCPYVKEEHVGSGRKLLGETVPVPSDGLEELDASLREKLGALKHIPFIISLVCGTGGGSEEVAVGVRYMGPMGDDEMLEMVDDDFEDGPEVAEDRPEVAVSRRGDGRPLICNPFQVKSSYKCVAPGHPCVRPKTWVPEFMGGTAKTQMLNTMCVIKPWSRSPLANSAVCECAAKHVKSNRECVPCEHFGDLEGDVCSMMNNDAELCNAQYGCVYTKAKFGGACEEATPANIRAAIASKAGQTSDNWWSLTRQHKTDRDTFHWVKAGAFSDISAWAFCGGGSAANFKWLGFLHGLFHAKNLRTLDELFPENTVVGSNSGGGWLFTDMFFSSEINGLFKTDGKDKSKLEAAIQARLNVQYDTLFNRKGEPYAYSPRNPGSAAYHALEKFYGKDINGWERFIRDIHAGYSKTPLNNEGQHIHWVSVTLGATKVDYATDNKNKVHVEIVRDQLAAAPGDWAPAGTIAIPTLLHFDGSNGFEPLEIDTPWLDWVSGPTFTVDVGGTLHNVDINKFKGNFINKLKVAGPQGYSVPSSDAPAMMLVGHRAHSTAGAFLFSRTHFAYQVPMKANNEWGFTFVDGGARDNAGLAAAIRGWQTNPSNIQDTKWTGDSYPKFVVVLGPYKGNHEKYFGFQAWDNKPNPGPRVVLFDRWIHKVTYAGDKERGHLMFDHYYVRTVDNLPWGITGNQHYEIIFVEVGPGLEALPVHDDSYGKSDKKRPAYKNSAIWASIHMQKIHMDHDYYAKETNV